VEKLRRGGSDLNNFTKITVPISFQLIKISTPFLVAILAIS